MTGSPRGQLQAQFPHLRRRFPEHHNNQDLVAPAILANCIRLELMNGSATNLNFRYNIWTPCTTIRTWLFLDSNSTVGRYVMDTARHLPQHRSTSRIDIKIKDLTFNLNHVLASAIPCSHRLRLGANSLLPILFQLPLSRCDLMVVIIPLSS